MAPRDKRKTKIQNTKKKRAIATRLMKISLKLDDYIYKNKQISLQDAHMYIDEIKTYKLKCSKDIRSLQVIDKLTICMKNIIKESTDNDLNENDNLTNTNIASFSSINTHPNVEYFEKETTKSTSPNFDAYESNPVIQHNKDTETNISQSSIISEIQNNETNNENNYFSKQNGNIVSKEKNQQALNSITTNVDDNINKNELEVNETNNILNAQNNNFNSYNKDLITYDKTQSNNNKNVIEVVKTKKKPRSKKENVAQEDKNTKNSTKNNKMNNKNVHSNQRKKIGKETGDVTWIENIKYVREVCSDERVTLNLEETFWRDSTLPVDFNFDD